MSGLIAEFNAGGIFMYIILAISLFSVAVIIYKVRLLFFKLRLPFEDVTQAIVRQVEANRYAQAIQYCNAKAHPLTNILKSVLLRANKSEKEIRRAVEVSAADELPRIKKLTAMLPHLSNVATMVGLLGTIRGLIIAFSGMEGGDAVKRQEALSTGIALAFRATFFALSVAVVLVLSFVILHSKQTQIIERIEHSVTSLVDIIVGKNAQMLADRQGMAAAEPRARRNA